MRSTLSLCMIVKDEEHQLDRCLSSVEGVVDEIVLVDTGSTDHTIAIAERYGARIVHHPWDGSFSSARNVSLDHATGDWVLILDADEKLTEGEQLRATLDAADDKFEAFILPLVNFLGERANEDAVTAPSIRIFRNRPEYRYSRALHEQILAAINQARPDAVTGYLNTPIEHFGYLNPVVAGKDKIRRNLALAEEECRRYPDDAFSWYNLAQEHFRLGQWADAIDAYRRGFPYLDSLAAGFAPALIKHLTVSLLNLNRNEEARAVLADAREAYETFTDLWVLEGLSWYQDKDFENAAKLFRQALDKGEVAGVFFMSDEGVGSYKSWWWLASCEAQLNRLEDAERSFCRSLELLQTHHRYQAPPIVGLLQVWRGLGRSDAEIEAALRAAVQLDDPHWRQIVVRTLFEQGCSEVGFALLDGQDDCEPMAILARGVAELRRGAPDAALEWWSRIAADEPIRRQADWHALLAYAVKGDLAGARALFTERLEARGEPLFIELYRGLLDLWSGLETPPPTLRMEALREHVMRVLELLLQGGRPDLFGQSLPALVWAGVGRADSLALAGRLYQQAGLFDEALGMLVAAAEAGDDSSDTLQRLGLLCLRRGGYAEAEALLGEVVRRERTAGSADGARSVALAGYLSARRAQGQDSEAESSWLRRSGDSGATISASAA